MLLLKKVKSRANMKSNKSISSTRTGTKSFTEDGHTKAGKHVLTVNYSLSLIQLFISLMNEQTNEQTKGKTNEQTNEQKNEQTNE